MPCSLVSRGFLQQEELVKLCAAIRREAYERAEACCAPWISDEHTNDGSEFVQIQASAADQIAAAIRALGDSDDG